MTLDASEVRAGVSGHIYLASVGTTMPTDTGTPLDAAFIEAGYTETGPSTNTDTTTEDVTGWQSQAPLRELITAQVATATIKLMQRNAHSLKAAYGGGTVTDLGGGDRKFTPPATATVNERAVVFEIVDGDIIDRYCIARASVSLSGEVAFVKDAATGYELTLKYLSPSAGGASWCLITNDDNVEVDA